MGDANLSAVKAKKAEILSVVETSMIKHLDKEYEKKDKDLCLQLADLIALECKNEIKKRLPHFLISSFVVVLINSEQTYGFSNNYFARLTTDGAVTKDWYNEDFLCFVSIFAVDGR